VPFDAGVAVAIAGVDINREGWMLKKSKKLTPKR
jgi:hypothetical protein